MAPSTEGRGGNDMRIKASSMEFRKMPQAPLFVESCSSSFLLQIACGHSRSSSDTKNNSSDSARVSGKCLAKHWFYHCCPSVRPVFHPIITWWYASSIRSHSLWASIKWFRVSFPLYLSISLSFCKSRTEHDMTLPYPSHRDPVMVKEKIRKYSGLANPYGPLFGPTPYTQSSWGFHELPICKKISKNNTHHWCKNTKHKFKQNQDQKNILHQHCGETVFVCVCVYAQECACVFVCVSFSHFLFNVMTLSCFLAKPTNKNQSKTVAQVPGGKNGVFGGSNHPVFFQFSASSGSTSSSLICRMNTVLEK